MDPFKYFGANRSSSDAYRVILSGMDQMLADLSSRDPGSSYLEGLQSLRGGFKNFGIDARRPDDVQAQMLAADFARSHQQWNTSFTQLEEQRQTIEREQKEQADRLAAEQAAALEQQRKEAQRLQNYATNMGSGDLAGPGTPPTVISGGSQSVDSSRLDIGGSSTARRRRGRGISAQLGL